MAIFSVFFSVYIPFSSLSCFRSKISQFWFKVVLYISFSSFEFSSLKFSIFHSDGLQTHLFFIFSFSLRFSLIFPDENIILHHFFITPGDFWKFVVVFSFFSFERMIFCRFVVFLFQEGKFSSQRGSTMLIVGWR